MKSKKLNITPEELQARLQAGETMTAIGKSFGVSQQAVGWFMDKHNMPKTRVLQAHRPRPQGKFIDQWGYIMIRTSSRAGQMAYTPEHVLVAEQKLGRKLANGEVIHHINGLKQDNRPENLHVCSRKDHMVIHKGLEALAMELVNTGQIIFDGTAYRWAPPE